MEEQGVPTQKLLLPQTFDVPPRDADWIERNLSILQRMGIGIESFGPDTFKIDSLPSFLNVSDPAQFMRKVIDDLKSASNTASAMRLGEEMIAKSVCRHAVKANDPLRYPEVEKLIRDLLDCDLPYCCPHGRPTMIQISLCRVGEKIRSQSVTLKQRSGDLSRCGKHRCFSWESTERCKRDVATQMGGLRRSRAGRTSTSALAIWEAARV